MSSLRWQLTLLLTLAAGCGKPPAEASPQGTSPKEGELPAVTLVKPVRQTVRREVGQPGHIEAYYQTPIYAKIAGFVDQVHVDIEDPITGPAPDAGGKSGKGKRGTLLAELRVPELVEELKQKEAQAAQAAEEIRLAEELVQVAEANVHSAEAKVKETEAGLVRAQAEIERWRVEYVRAEDQLRRKLLDEQTRDVTRYQFESAKAALAEVGARIESAKAAVKEGQAKLRKAKADVTVAQSRQRAAQADRDHTAALLEYTRLEAPYDGVVTWRNANPGDLVQPAAAGSKGEPLFIVAQDDPVRVFVEVPETDAVWVRKGDPVRLHIRGRPGEEFDGQVTRSTVALDARARTLRTEIDVSNPGHVLRPGMYAFATLTLERKGVWTLPLTAVVLGEGQAFYYRVEKGKAVKTPVRVGLSDGKRIEVVQKQLRAARPGEKGVWEDVTGAEEVVATNPGALTDGQPVKVN
jgi:RND family efflux transporter MFP subunit